MILKGYVVGPFASNCYLVGSETAKEGMIIDGGAEGEVVLKDVKEEGLTIKFIVATHGHMDHVGAIGYLKEETGAQFALHADEQESLKRHPQFAQAFMDDPGEPPEPDRLLKGGDVLEIGELRFTVLHTPGHSPGGLCLYGHGVVFTGDTLFNMGIGRTDFPGSNHIQILNSIHTKLLILPDNTLVLPGHGPQSTIGNEMRRNPFLRGP